MIYCDNREHVFIVGSSRSGTSLLSSIIQASPEFACYRAETLLLNDAQVKYGSLVSAKECFFRDWFRSRQFKRSGLTESEVREATKGQNSYIGFLGTYMNMVADKQSCSRWIDDTPSNINCLKEISEAFPQAKIIHMVRDGRAVALSLAKLGWSGVSTDNIDKALCFSALKWRNAIKNVAQTKSFLGDRYIELKYEELVQNPSQSLRKISNFLGVAEFDLRLLESGFAEGNESINSTLRTPNSLFGDMTPGISTSAVFRWQASMNDDQISQVEATIGGMLEEYGYERVASVRQSVFFQLLIQWRKVTLWGIQVIKRRTPLGRFSASPLEIDFD